MYGQEQAQLPSLTTYNDGLNFCHRIRWFCLHMKLSSLEGLDSKLHLQRFLVDWYKGVLDCDRCVALSCVELRKQFSSFWAGLFPNRLEKHLV
jgi:hypothetical protein